MTATTIYYKSFIKDDAVYLFLMNEKHKYISTALKNEDRLSEANINKIRKIINQKTLVGCQNYIKDDIILTLMLKDLSATMIIENYIMLSKTNIRTYQIDDVVSQSLDVSSESKITLQKYQANNSLKVTNIDDCKNTKSLINEVKLELKTIEMIYNDRKSFFETKKYLAHLLNNEKATRWSTNTVAGKLFKNDYKTVDKLEIDSNLLKNANIPTKAKKCFASNLLCESILDLFDNNVTLKSGGVHSVNYKRKIFNDVIHIDFESFYPSIIIENKFLANKTELYSDFKDKRVQYKNLDKNISEAYKLVLSKVFGNLKNKYNEYLFNPILQDEVIAIGQITILDLAITLSEKNIVIAQINTDGIYVENNSNVDIESIIESFIDKYHINITLEYYKKLIQKDVNSYILIDESEEIICKGDVKNYYHNSLNDNNMRIVSKCIVDKLVYNKDILTNIIDNISNVEMFQIVVNNTTDTLQTVDKKGNVYPTSNRLFAVKDEYKQDKIYIKREDNTLVNHTNVTDKMIIINDKLDDYDLKQIIDVDFYYNIICEKIKKWE